MSSTSVSDLLTKAALRADLVKRLLICLADADRLASGADAAIEISLAIHALGGTVPPPPIAEDEIIQEPTEIRPPSATISPIHGSAGERHPSARVPLQPSAEL